MNAYITTGTGDFLLKLVQKYNKEQMALLFGSGHSLLYHETSGKTVFQVPRKYQLIESVGDFPVKGFAVFHYLPVREEDQKVFEHELSKRPRKLDNATGFLALRILRPIKCDTYLIISCWIDKKSYELWKNMEGFAVPNEEKRSIEVNKRTMYAGESYLKEYAIGTDEKED
ncbi:antibiotic biosynthesis monooxygenase family protein [Bacillus andreraoultii]|uniref:antibiotic biosynthesis monooxygenase family protein n=1 Tax=Bacillus andreraoultii TaxID=1499685 RepID=UPI00053BB4F7|nr:antibiotic biosynthesis monooxygenase [Bacillus andreraoultii]